MVARFLGASALLLVVSLVVAPDAEAKGGIGVIVTGGELGSQAAFVVAAPLPGGPYSIDGWPLNTTAQTPVERPETLPPLAYEFYPASVLPYQVADGPAQRYYPELRLVHQRRVAARVSDAWYEVTPETAASIEASIENALAHRARGELENDVITASLRGRRLTEVTYWLRPYEEVPESDRSPWTTASLDRCEECIVLRPTDEFILRHYVETLRRSPIAVEERDSSAEAAFAIEFHWAFGMGGVGGLLGFYASPGDDRPGRFWLSDYAQDESVPYFDTTAGFDALVAEALADEEEPFSEEAKAEEQSSPKGTSFGVAVVIGGLAVACVALGGAAVGYARRWGDLRSPGRN